jgi:DNA repair protein RadC
MKVEEMMKEQRPREKALQHGLGSLNDHELLMLLISSGYKNHPVDEVAAEVLQKTDGLRKLTDMRVQELSEVKGISDIKALQLLGSIELCKRALRKKAYATSVHSAKDVAEWFRLEYGCKKQEHVVGVYLDTQMNILHHEVLFIGTLDSSQMHPREIFREAFLRNAAALMIVHNHPSGEVYPSDDDLETTARLEKVGEVMGIRLIDHIIVGQSSHYSFRKNKLLDL